jgi:Flp pilus assembly protein TadG
MFISRPRSRGVLGHCRGTAALEFALVSGVFFMLLFGIIELGLSMWIRSTLQTVAAQTARCAAIGSSACASGAAQYAVSLARPWLPIYAITTKDVVVSTTTTCFGASGNFESVTITAPSWIGGLVYPVAGGWQTMQACFPTS